MPDFSPGLDAAGPGRVLLLAALPQEVRPFLRLSRARRRRGLPWPAWEFAAGHVRGLLAVSGMGAKAAREAASRLVSQFRPQVLVSFGFGGALSPDLAAGDLVLGEFLARFNPETLPEPLASAPIPPKPLPELLRGLTAAGLAASAGSLITTPFIIHKGRQGGPLTSLPCPVLDLESAALAEVARDAGLSFLGLRAITDLAGEEIPDFLAPVGEEISQLRLLDALGWLAADPRRLKDLVHLWRRCRLAADRLAAALIILLPLFTASHELD